LLDGLRKQTLLCIEVFSHGHRKQSHLAKCPAAPFAAQWHLCGFTSTSYLPAVPNTLSLWRHRAWPIFRSGHFSNLPLKDSSSSFSSLCTFSRTWAVLQCTDEMGEEPEIFPSWQSSTFVTTAVSQCKLSFSGWCFLSCLQVLAVVEGAVLHFQSHFPAALSSPAAAEDAAAGTLWLTAQRENDKDNEACDEESDPNACDYWNIHDCPLLQGFQLFVDRVLHRCCTSWVFHPHIFRERVSIFLSPRIYCQTPLFFDVLVSFWC